MFVFLSLLLYAQGIATDGKFFEVRQHVGQNCGPTNVYNVDYVNVNPWPPTPGEKATITMVGQFLQTTYVQELEFGTLYNGMIWNYQPVDISKSYNAGNVIEFVMGALFPNEQGAYTSNLQLVSGSHISCWQFQYNIS